jgi:hypothetical protein
MYNDESKKLLKLLIDTNEPISKHIDAFDYTIDMFNFLKFLPYMYLNYNDYSFQLPNINFIYMIYKDFIENFPLFSNHAGIKDCKIITYTIISSYLEHYLYKNFDECILLLMHFEQLIKLLIENNFIQEYEGVIELLADVHLWFSIQHGYFSQNPILYKYKLTSDNNKEIMKYFDVYFALLYEGEKNRKQLPKNNTYDELEIKTKEYENELSKLYEKMYFVERENEELKEIIYKEEPKRKKKI